jgi:hypothetical protein
MPAPLHVTCASWNQPSPLLSTGLAQCAPRKVVLPKQASRIMPGPVHTIVAAPAGSVRGVTGQEVMIAGFLPKDAHDNDVRTLGAHTIVVSLKHDKSGRVSRVPLRECHDDKCADKLELVWTPTMSGSYSLEATASMNSETEAEPVLVHVKARPPVRVDVKPGPVAVLMVQPTGAASPAACSVLTTAAEICKGKLLATLSPQDEWGNASDETGCTGFEIELEHTETGNVTTLIPVLHDGSLQLRWLANETKSGNYRLLRALAHYEYPAAQTEIRLQGELHVEVVKQMLVKVDPTVSQGNIAVTAGDKAQFVLLVEDESGRRIERCERAFRVQLRRPGTDAAVIPKEVRLEDGVLRFDCDCLVAGKHELVVDNQPVGSVTVRPASLHTFRVNRTVAKQLVVNGATTRWIEVCLQPVDMFGNSCPYPDESNLKLEAAAKFESPPRQPGRKKEEEGGGAMEIICRSALNRSGASALSARLESSVRGDKYNVKVLGYELACVKMSDEAISPSVPLSFATGVPRVVNYDSLRLAEKERNPGGSGMLGAILDAESMLPKLTFGWGKATPGSWQFADAAHGHDPMGEFAGTEAVVAHPPAEEDQSTRASNSDDGGWHRLDAADEAAKQQALVLQPRLRHQQVPPPPRTPQPRRGGGARAA